MSLDSKFTGYHLLAMVGGVGVNLLARCYAIGEWKRWHKSKVPSGVICADVLGSIQIVRASVDVGPRIGYFAAAYNRYCAHAQAVAPD